MVYSKQNAKWYIPTPIEKNTAGLKQTINNPKYYFYIDPEKEGLEQRDIATEMKMLRQALDVDLSLNQKVYPFSIERIALHETIIGICLKLKTGDEKKFYNTFQDIFNNHVLPALQEQKDGLEKHTRKIAKEVKKNVRSFFEYGFAIPKYQTDIRQADKVFKDRLAHIKSQLEELKIKAATSRLDLGDRQRRYELEETLDYMQDHKESIIADYLINKNTQDFLQRKIRELVWGGPNNSGQNVLGSESVLKNYAPLTQHSVHTRTSFLIVGGPASGKSSITEKVKHSQLDPIDVLELNPDHYKSILLDPASIEPEMIQYFGTLTHAESSLIFDEIARLWKEMALAGLAPNLLLDVARAGRWVRDLATKGGTRCEIHSPTLPIEEALNRSFLRGKKSNRFVPTEVLILGHKDQPSLNLDAMKNGFDFTLYSTNVPFGTHYTDIPVVAQFQSKSKVLKIEDPKQFFDYLRKADLNPKATNVHELPFSNPEKVVRLLLDHAKYMSIVFIGKDGKPMAAMEKESNGFVLKIFNRVDFREKFGSEVLYKFLYGLAEHNIKVIGESPRLLARVRNDILNDRHARAMVQKRPFVHPVPETERYIELLRELVKNGRKFAKTDNNFVYDIRNNETKFPKGVRIVTINPDTGSIAEINQYDPSVQKGRDNMLVIDPKIIKTPEGRERILSALKERGVYEGEGVYLVRRNKLYDDYVPTGEIKNDGFFVMEPNPNAVRRGIKIKYRTTIPVEYNEKPYTIEPEGWMFIREKDVKELAEALEKYDKTGDIGLLIRPDGRAVFDVYGTDPFFGEDKYAHALPSFNDMKSTIETILEYGMPCRHAVKNESYIAYQVPEKDHYVIPRFDTTEGVSHPCWLVIKVADVPKFQKLIEMDSKNENLSELKEICSSSIITTTHDGFVKSFRPLTSLAPQSMGNSSCKCKPT